MTAGALQQLNRDELQGVIGHEFSHILNGDMRLNVRLIGLLAGILLLGLVGLRILAFGGGGRGREGQREPACWSSASPSLVLGFVGQFFAGAHPGRGVAATRVARRRLVGAVHPADRSGWSAR